MVWQADNSLPEPASVAFQRIADRAANDPSLTVSDVRVTLGQLSLYMPLFVLSVLSLLLCFIPGISFILGLPILFLTVQIAINRDAIWLPAKVLSRPAPRHIISRVYPRIISTLHVLERFSHPRYLPFAEVPYTYLSAFLLVSLSVFFILPIPLGNVAPALAMALLGFGHAQKDGTLIAIGQIFGLMTLGALLVVATLVYGGFEIVSVLASPY